MTIKVAAFTMTQKLYNTKQYKLKNIIVKKQNYNTAFHLDI